MKIQSILITVAYLLSAGVVGAVCLKGHPSPSEEYTGSLAVLIGQVVAAEAVPQSKDYYEGNNYTVQVLEVFRGDVNDTIVLFSENSSGRFPMSVGSHYILFVYEELGRLQINNCGNSGLLTEKEHVVQIVRKLMQDAHEK